ncbi:MAG: Helix-turn-helix domain [Firmicutes bacterium]|nr:Helix-turn-helix domain [Bacillota bacterium]
MKTENVVSMKTVSEKQLAEIWNLKPSTVRLMRLRDGLPHVWAGNRVRYRLEAVEQWWKERETASTSAANNVVGFGKIREVRR